MQILALIHEPGPCSGVFVDSAAERGDTIEEWSLAWGTPPSRPLDEYEAVFAFGGVMNTHEEESHPWLREENMLMQRFLDQGVPLLGICLGGQLIAKAAQAPVTRAAEPEIGWCDVELLPDRRDDPVFNRLPSAMKALQWHHYRFDLPGGAVAAGAESGLSAGVPARRARVGSAVPLRGDRRDAQLLDRRGGRSWRSE